MAGLPHILWVEIALTFIGKVIKLLANHGSSSTGLVQWDSPPDFILPYYQRDYVGLPHYSFRQMLFCWSCYILCWVLEVLFVMDVIIVKVKLYVLFDSL